MKITLIYWDAVPQTLLLWQESNLIWNELHSTLKLPNLGIINTVVNNVRVSVRTKTPKLTFPQKLDFIAITTYFL